MNPKHLPGWVPALFVVVLICSQSIAMEGKRDLEPTPGRAVASAQEPADLVFITATIHGQVGAAFSVANPSLLSPPSWVHDVQTTLGLRIDEINSARTGASLAPVTHASFEGDWARLTWFGAQSILSGRVLDLLSGIAFLPQSTRQRAQETGAAYADLGRVQTSNMSQFAAIRFADQLDNEIDSLQTANPDATLFVDLVVHSRGGAVGSELLRRLKASDVNLSITYLDGIDPTPNGLPTLAGNLLGDPTIRRSSNERISNFHAEYGFLAEKDDSSFFGADFYNWLIAYGAQFTEEDLVNLGYPRGRSRPELFPNPDPLEDVNLLVGGESHLSLQEAFTSLNDVKTGQPPASTFSFSATSYLGELIQDPLLISPGLPASGSPEKPVLLASDLPEDFVRDGDFVKSSLIVENATLLIGDTFFLLVLPDELSFLETLLLITSTQKFPFSGVWERTGSGVTIFREDDIPRAQLLSGSVLSQDLDIASVDLGGFLLTVDYEFLSGSGALTAALQGDRLYKSSTVTAAESGVGQRRTLTLIGARNPGTPSPAPDSVLLAGSQVALEVVSVSLVSGDVVSYILRRSTSAQDGLDLNDDGAVDCADLIRSRTAH